MQTLKKENTWLEEIRWNSDGLIPAIAQEADTGRILMMAWMNAESLALTAQKKEAVYWSRSRNSLWHKGETSGHIQQVHEIRLDCDEDVIVLQVTQIGDIACHTGRHSCFYRVLKNEQWEIVEPVLKNPSAIYLPKTDKE
jgi:phosphoribosyl-AMP cyclohydrolase